MSLIAVGIVIAGVPAVTTSSTDTQIGPGDSDADRLRDRWEYKGVTPEGYALPESDPYRKDLFLVVIVPENVDPLSERERSDLVEIWDAMPIPNPSGQTGVALHIQQRRIGASATFDGSRAEFHRLRKEYYSETIIGDGLCVAHVGLLVSMPQTDEYAGRGDGPGYFLVADGTLTDDYGQEYTVRTAAITHELLHNIVGEFPNGEVHTNGGWLDGQRGAEHGTNFFMSDRTRAKLSDDGFAESEYYTEVVC